MLFSALFEQAVQGKRPGSNFILVLLVFYFFQKGPLLGTADKYLALDKLWNRDSDSCCSGHQSMFE